MSNARAFALICLLYAAGLAAGGQFAKMAIPFPEIQALYPDATGWHGWLVSVISLLGAIFGIAAGGLIGRFRAEHLLLAGMALGAVLSMVQATLPGFSVLMASRVVEGVSHLAIVVAAPTLIAAVAPPSWQGAAMAVWSTFFGVAFALTAWIGLPLVDARGPGALFLWHGWVMAAILGVLAIMLAGRRTQAPAHRPAAQPRASLMDTHRRAYGSPFVIAPALGWLFYTLTFVSLLALLPERLPEAVRQTLTGALPLIGIGVSIVIVPLLLTRLGGIGVTVLGFALSMVAVLSHVFGLSLATASLALFAAFGLVQGGSFAAIPALNRDQADRALAYGAMAQTGNTGNLLGTPVLLALLGQYGETGAFFAVACLYALAIAVHLWLAARRRALS